MNPEVMQSLLAGWVSGAAAGLAMTAVVLVWAARRPQLAARLPGQAKLPILGIIAANAMVIGLTLVGLVLGAIYHATSHDVGGGIFPFVIAGVLLAGAVLYAFIRGRVLVGEAPLVISLLVLAGLAFAGMLPWLAGMDVS